MAVMALRSPVTVTPAQADEAGTLATLAGATFPLACPPTVDPADIAAFAATELSAERFTAHLAAPDTAVLLARSGEAEPLGYALLFDRPPADPAIARQVPYSPAVEVSKFYLLPAAHGTGAATAMMEAVLSAARDRGAAGVWLGVNQQNVRAQRFYAKAGFAQIGTKTFRLGAHIHDDFILGRTV